MFSINNHKIGKNFPTYIIAELSCNHNQNINIAYKLIDEAKKAGANAIKLQTYKADTMTIKSDNPLFKDCLNGTLWEGKTLYDLYSEAYTPWEWTKELKEYANSLEMDLFSSPFDTTAVDFLEKLDIPAYKIASFEIVDHVLIKRIAQTGKPVIISSGMASFEELQEAIDILRNNGCKQICMLKCTSAYPAKTSDANLLTMKDMSEKFNVITGLSDHTLGIEVPIASVVLGGCVIEKHFTLSRNSGSADDAFSLIPEEFKKMVDSVRIVEQTLGKITYGGVKKENSSKKFRKSLFIVEDIKKGDKLTNKNVKPIRPSYGIHTKFYEDVLGETALVDIKKGTPLHFNLITCSSEKLKNQKEIKITEDIQDSKNFFEKYNKELIESKISELQIDIIVQARTGSTRLPNKLMKYLEDKLVIEHVIERLKRSQYAKNIIICTTDKKNDDVIENFCIDKNIKYYRGSENNVLKRYYDTASLYKSQIIVRITSDCPLVDPNIVDNMIFTYLEKNLKFLHPKYSFGDNQKTMGGFPDGCNPQIFSFELLKETYSSAITDFDKEHVCPYMVRKFNNFCYQIPDIDIYKNIDFKTLHLSLDTPDDYQKLKIIFENVYKNNEKFTIYDVLEFLNNK